MIGVFNQQKTIQVEVSDFEKMILEQIRNLQEGQQMILFKRGGKSKIKFTIQIKSEQTRFLIFKKEV